MFTAMGPQLPSGKPEVLATGRGTEWIVVLNPDATARLDGVAGAAEALAATAPGVRVVRGLGARGLLLVASDGDAEAAGARLAALPIVDQVERNGTITAAGRHPDDPRYADGTTWGLRNLGLAGGLVGADIAAATAWEVTAGDPSVVVAVIDGGIDISHPDLAANVWRNPGEVAGNRVDDDANGFVDDVYGWNFHGNNPVVFESGDNDHGTLVAGIVAARGDNGIGGLGVAWNARIMPLKFIGPDGEGPTSGAISAIHYATMMRQRGVNLRVINASWGGAPFSASLQSAIRTAGEAGILFVASAGNAGVDQDWTLWPNYPSGYALPNIVAVAATDNRDQRWSSSNYGRTRVHLAAPGVGIHGTVPGGGYGFRTGTSFAAPFVAGVAALAVSVDPTITVSALKQALIDGVDRLPSLATTTVGGGRLNAARTVALVAAARPLEERIVTVPEGGTSIETDRLEGPLQLVKQGAGRLVLPSANEHRGGTIVEQGTLELRDPSGLGHGPLVVRSGAAVVFDVAAERVVLGGLDLASGGKIDLGGGGFTVREFPVDHLRAALLAGRNGGSWDGPIGITSRAVSMFGGGAGFAVGYREEPDGTVLAAWAALGDADLDGLVTTADVNAMLTGGLLNTGRPGATWQQGDFDYDGLVTTADLNALLTGGRLNAGTTPIGVPGSQNT